MSHTSDDTSDGATLLINMLTRLSPLISLIYSSDILILYTPLYTEKRQYYCSGLGLWCRPRLLVLPCLPRLYSPGEELMVLLGEVKEDQ